MAWSKENLKDQTGKTVLVTGANSGLGYDTSLVLAAKGAHIIMASRSLERGNAARDKILARVPNASLELRELDLGDLNSVAKFSDELHRDNVQIDVLVNNAGLMMPPRELTKQGFESQIGVNHLGHFALTMKLLDLLGTASSNGNKEPARIVNVSSISHRSGRMNFDDLQSEKSYSPMGAYGQSKVANLYFTYEMVRKLKNAGSPILSVASHPGLAATNLSQSLSNPILKFIAGIVSPLIAQSSAMGALPSIRAAVDPEVKSGEYFGPTGFGGMRGAPDVIEPADHAKDEAIAARLWDVSEELTGEKWPL